VYLSFLLLDLDNQFPIPAATATLKWQQAKQPWVIMVIRDKEQASVRNVLWEEEKIRK